MHAQLVDLRGVGKPGLAKVFLDTPPGRGDGSLRLPLALIGRTFSGTSTAAHRQRDVEAKAHDGLTPADAVLRDVRPGGETRHAIRAREVGL